MIDQFEFEQAIGLLQPLETVAGIPPAIVTESALLETSAYLALHQPDLATAACRVAIRASDFDPNVGRDQSPRVQAICTAAAEVARREWVVDRHIAIRDSRIVPGQVAWTPTRVESRILGDLTGLDVQAMVRTGADTPITINLAASQTDMRLATLDENRARPGIEVSATIVVRDRFGILLSSEAPATAVISPNEAAVRFSPGGDQGPLRIDGVATGRSAAPGLVVPLPPGAHTLEVRSPQGTSSTRVMLTRGEVASVTIRNVVRTSVRDVAKWGTTGAAVLLLGTGAVFQFLAYTTSAELVRNSMQRDPSSGLPLIRYADVASLDSSRQNSQLLAYGFFAGGGLLAVTAILLWTLPGGSNSNAESPRAAGASGISFTGFGIGPNGGQIQLSF